MTSLTANARSFCGRCNHPMHWRECGFDAGSTGGPCPCRNDRADRADEFETPGYTQAPALPVIDAFCDCPSCEGRTKAMYDLPGRCSNCGARFTVRNRKGDKAALSVECPSCEVTVYGWRATV